VRLLIVLHLGQQVPGERRLGERRLEAPYLGQLVLDPRSLSPRRLEARSLGGRRLGQQIFRLRLLSPQAHVERPFELQHHRLRETC
jgi:hypothetical protein